MPRNLPAISQPTRITVVGVAAGVVLGALTFSGLGVPAPSRAAAAPLAVAAATFDPTADTYVDASNPTSNFGTRAFLRVDGSPIKTSFVQFDVEGVSDFATVALSIYFESGSSAGVDVRSVAIGAWDETAMTYETAPPVGPVVASSGAVPAGTWSDLDISPIVSANGVVTLAITTSGPTAIRLASRESAYPPRLTVSAAPSGDVEPPGQPGNLLVDQTHSWSGPKPFELQLSWDSTTDNVGVAGYTVYRDGTPLAVVDDGTLVYLDTDVLPETSYTYAIDAYDAAGNHSALSAGVDVTTPPLPSTYVLGAEADAYVNSTKPDARYGSASVLRIDGSPEVRSYLRFNVRGVASDVVVKRATLRLYTPNSPSAIGYEAHGVPDNTWDESTITYASAPTAGAVVGTSQPFSIDGVPAHGDEVDVTQLVSGNGTFSLALTTPGSTALRYSSRESAAQPELVIETGAPDQPPASGVLFTDGFETGDLAQWHQIDLGVVASQDIVKNGSWAARATNTDGTHAYAVAALDQNVNEATYTLWFNIVAQGSNNLYLMRARRTVDKPVAGVYVTASGRLATRNESSSSSLGSITSATSVTPGWHLLEVHVVVGGSSGSLMEVWLDGAIAVSRTDSLGTDPLGVVEIGDRQSGHLGDVAFDDVEVTTP